MIAITGIAIGGAVFYFGSPNEVMDLTANSSKKTISAQGELIKNSSNKNLGLLQKQIIKTNKSEVKLANSSITKPENEHPFSGISRLSDKAKFVLESAGLLPTDLNNAAFVEFDLESLRKLEIGDTFDLDIPQTTENFTAEVTQVDMFGNGDKSIIGSVTGLDGKFHTTVITVGKDALYGQFTTVSGNWVFESKDQYGWIAAKRDLYKSHVEFEPVASGSVTKGADDTFAPKLTTKNISKL